MKLAIDIGNTSAKYTVFQGNVPIKSDGGSNRSGELLDSMIEANRIDSMIVSTVANPSIPFRKRMEAAKIPTLWLSSETPVPVKVAYGSRDTLGSDRLAGVVGAAVLLPGKDVLVVDMGTCITYDYINGKGLYLGGNIAPGMAMRFRAMHQETARLPLAQAAGEWPELMGRNTEEALRSGVLTGIVAETEYYINRLRQECPGLEVILTGGDREIFKKYIHKDGIRTDEWLVARGLNRILEYNED